MGWAISTIIPINKDVSAYKVFHFLDRHLFRIICAIQRLHLHPYPHSLSAYIVMSSATITAHTLHNPVALNLYPVERACVLDSPVTVDDFPIERRKCLMGILYCGYAQLRFHNIICHHKPKYSQIITIKDGRDINFTVAGRNLNNICYAGLSTVNETTFLRLFIRYSTGV